MPPERQTILIAGGLERRAGRREQEAVLTATEARDFRGSVEVHDARGAGPRAARDRRRRSVRIHPSLLEADLIVC